MQTISAFGGSTPAPTTLSGSGGAGTRGQTTGSLRPALVMTGLFFLLTGILYPMGVTVLAQLLFADEANGSLVRQELGPESSQGNGPVVGSALIGQPFVSPAYLQPRPSAAGTGYDGMASGGSNLGPTSQALQKRVQAEIVRLQAENPQKTAPIPVALVTASGSGLDPHLPVEAVRWQLPRIAAARQVELARLESLLESRVETPLAGLGGAPMVNVLRFNLALDRQLGLPVKQVMAGPLAVTPDRGPDTQS